MDPVVDSRVTVRWRLRFLGTVQGIGFRPFVYKLAHDFGFGGSVLNDSGSIGQFF